MMEEPKESPVLRLFKLIVSEISDKDSYWLGQVLTIIDASISDPEQRKGLKDLIRNARIGEWYERRIGQILMQFTDKFSKIETPDKERYFLENGEWPNNPVVSRLGNQNYFPD